MSAYSHGESDPSYRYWQAAISCLSTPEKRAVADEFLRTRLEGGRGADTLFALILLLEANGIFMEGLPEKFSLELIRPLNEALTRLRSEMETQVEGQRQASRAIGIAHDDIDAAANLVRQTTAEFESRVQAAVREVNVRELAARISTSIDCLLKPIKQTLHDLDDRSAKLVHASSTAERSVETWRKAHFGGVVTVCFLTAFLFAGIVSGIAWWRIDHRYQQRIAAEVVRLSGTDDAYRQLLMLGISIHLAQWVDASGNPVKHGTAVFIEDAEESRIEPTRDGTRATVLVKAHPLIRRIEAISRELEKLQSKELPARR